MGDNQSKVHQDVDIEKFYKMYAVIGRGAFATVRQGRRKGARKKDKDVAIKIVRTSALEDDEKRGVKEEIRLLLNITHPNIVNLHEVYVTEKCVYLVMELFGGGEMFDRICDEGFFSEVRAAFSIVQILDALIYLHGLNICHRDIKPENLFYSTRRKKSKLVIGDFGFAKWTKDPMQTMCGTPEYVAPEILMNTPYCHKVDCWSLGILLYVLLCGYPPFYGETVMELYGNVLTKPLVFEKEDWQHISEEAKDLITKLLDRDPTKRLTAEEAKKHSWITKTITSTNERGLGKVYQKRMRRYVAVQRMRAGVTTMIAMWRMAKILKRSIEEDMNPVVVGNDLNTDKVKVVGTDSKGEEQDDLNADIEIISKVII